MLGGGYYRAVTDRLHFIAQRRYGAPEIRRRDALRLAEGYAVRTEALLDSLFHKTDVLESIVITGRGDFGGGVPGFGQISGRWRGNPGHSVSAGRRGFILLSVRGKWRQLLVIMFLIIHVVVMMLCWLWTQIGNCAVRPVQSDTGRIGTCSAESHFSDR